MKALPSDSVTPRCSGNVALPNLRELRLLFLYTIVFRLHWLLWFLCFNFLEQQKKRNSLTMWHYYVTTGEVLVRIKFGSVRRFSGISFSVATKCDWFAWCDVIFEQLAGSVQMAEPVRSSQLDLPALEIFTWTLNRVELIFFIFLPHNVSSIFVVTPMFNHCSFSLQINGKSCPRGFSWDYRARRTIAPPGGLVSLTSTCEWSSCKQTAKIPAVVARKEKKRKRSLNKILAV